MRKILLITLLAVASWGTAQPNRNPPDYLLRALELTAFAPFNCPVGIRPEIVLCGITTYPFQFFGDSLEGALKLMGVEMLVPVPDSQVSVYTWKADLLTPDARLLMVYEQGFVTFELQ